MFTCFTRSLIIFFLFSIAAPVRAQVTSGFPIEYVWLGPTAFTVESMKGKYMVYKYNGEFIESFDARRTQPLDVAERKISDRDLNSALEKYPMPELYDRHFVDYDKIVVNKEEVYKWTFTGAYKEYIKHYNAATKTGVAYTEKSSDYNYYSFTVGSTAKPNKLKMPNAVAVSFAGEEVFSADGKYMATGNRGILYDIENEKVVWKDKLYEGKKIMDGFGDPDKVRCTFSSDGKQVAFNNDERIVVFDIQNGDLVKEIKIETIPDDLTSVSKTRHPVNRGTYTIYPCPDMNNYLVAPKPDSYNQDDEYRYHQSIFIVTPDKKFTLVNAPGAAEDLLAFRKHLDIRAGYFTSSPSPKKTKTAAELKEDLVKAYNDQFKALDSRYSRYETDATAVATTIKHNGNKYCCLSKIDNLKTVLKGLLNDYEKLLKDYDSILNEEARENIAEILKNLRNEQHTINSL